MLVTMTGLHEKLLEKHPSKALVKLPVSIHVKYFEILLVPPPVVDFLVKACPLWPG